MKILFVSIQALHTARWIENLSKQGHDLYWFDILGRGELTVEATITQISNWEKRKFPYFKGEHFLRKKYPNFYESIQPYLEVTANEKLEELIHEIQPDLVHSFELHTASYPILKTMLRFPNLKWMYSCWGSDFYKYRNSKPHLDKIQKVMQRIDYLHTDCLRDYQFALNYGFEGFFSGVLPGGGGFHMADNEENIMPVANRRIILVKGYQHHVGRGLQIIQALEKIQEFIKDYEVIVFGTHAEISDYIENNALSFKYYGRHDLQHHEVLTLMGKSLLYIGSSISDGMPNTLLEAIFMGAFPIQSNPGGVTAEVITPSVNGLLIENPESVAEIAEKIKHAIENHLMLVAAFSYNQEKVKPNYEYHKIQQKIVALYHQIEKEL